MVVRALLVLVAVALAGAAVAEYRRWRGQHAEVVRLLDETGLAVRQPDLAERIRREPDPLMGRVRVARALVAEAQDPAAFTMLSARDAMLEAGRVGERLELAETLASEALTQRPVVWQAAMIVGAARYLQFSRRGDPRLFTDRAAWQEPLDLAHRLAPGEDEPVAFLAAAGLDIWPYVDAAQQRAITEHLRRAFRIENTWGQLAATWFAVAGDRDRAFSLVPERAAAWDGAAAILAGGVDWEGVCAARRRARILRLAEAGALARLGAEHAGHGDAASGREALLKALDAAPADRGSAAVVAQAVAAMPAGPLPAAGAGLCRRWLEWGVEWWVRGDPSLAPTTLARLTSLAGDLPPAVEAVALVAAGDLGAAESIERRHGALNTEAWAPYCLGKAVALVHRNELAAAESLLSAMNREWRARPVGLLARAAVAQARGDVGAIGEAQQALLRAGSASWANTDWLWRGGVARLEVLAGRAAPNLQVLVDVAPVAGAVVAVCLDGSLVGEFPVRPGVALVVPMHVAAGSHLIELESVAGGSVVPGATILGIGAAAS